MIAGNRHLRLKEFFYDSEESDGEEYQPNPFRRRKKCWTPTKNREPALESYIQALNKCEGVAPPEGKKKDNLTREERGDLKSLRNRLLTGEIVTKPADKGSATVVMSHDDYVAEAMRQLMREEYYLLLGQRPHH